MSFAYSKVAGSKATEWYQKRTAFFSTPLFRATFESKNANVKATEWYQKRTAFFSTPPFRAGIVRIFFTAKSDLLIRK